MNLGQALESGTHRQFRFRGVLHLEGAAVRPVDVVRDGEHVTAVLGGTVGRQRLPERPHLRKADVIEHLVRNPIAAIDHVAMPVAAARRRRPLVANQRCERAGFVGVIGGKLRAAPLAGAGRGAVEAVLAANLGRLRGRVGDQRQEVGVEDVPGQLALAVTALANGVAVGVVGVHRVGAHIHDVVGRTVVGHCGEVQRPIKRRGCAVGHAQRLALGKGVRVLGGRDGAERVGVQRIGGVYVQVAPEQLLHAGC